MLSEHVVIINSITITAFNVLVAVAKVWNS